MAYSIEQAQTTGNPDEFSMACTTERCEPGEIVQAAGYIMRIVRPLTPLQARINNPTVFLRFIRQFPSDVLLWYQVTFIHKPANLDPNQN